MLSRSLLPLIPLVSLTALASAQDSNPNPYYGFPINTFTIRPPEGCDKECKDTLCTIPGVCLPCGSGMCTGDESCGTYAGHENWCCLHYGFSIDGSKTGCDDHKDFLVSLDIDSSRDAQPATVRGDGGCHQDEVIAAYTVGSEWQDQGNVTCCPKGRDSVVRQGEEYGVALQVVCVEEQAASQGDPDNDDDLSGGDNDNDGNPTDDNDDGDGNPNTNGNGDGTSGAGRIVVGALALPIAVFATVFL